MCVACWRLCLLNDGHVWIEDGEAAEHGIAIRVDLEHLFDEVGLQSIAQLTAIISRQRGVLECSAVTVECQADEAIVADLDGEEAGLQLHTRKSRGERQARRE